MPLSYHLIDYAIIGLLYVLFRLVHPLFLIPFIIVFLIVVYSQRFEAVIVTLIIVAILSRPEKHIDLPARLHGTVINMQTNSVIIKTEYGNVKLYNYSETLLLYGDKIDVQVSYLDIDPPDNDYGFDEHHYLKSKHIVAKGRIESFYDITHHFHLANKLESMMSSHDVIQSYQRLFILGVRDEEMNEDYKTMSHLSIVHMFALSGMHIMILYTMIQTLFVLFIDKEKTSIIAKIILGFYVYNIPYNVSLERAYLMLVLVELLKDHFNALDVLSGLFLWKIFQNAYIIFNMSFVFSYVIYLAVLLTRGMKGQSFLIYLSSIPLILCTSYTINILSYLLVNLLEPVIKIFYVTTVLSMIFAILQPILELEIKLFEAILLFTNDMSSFITFSKPNLMFIVLFYSAYLSLLVHRQMNQSIKHEVLFLISLMFVFHIYSTYKIYDEVTMINVGQGDCTLIRLAMNQGNILIDTGGNHNYDLATSTIIPYLRAIGVNRLDYVYISHYDFDHCGALDSLKQHFKVRNVIDKYEAHRSIGSLSIDMLSTGSVYDNLNDNSLLMYVTLHNVHYFFTGDMGINTEDDLYTLYKDKKLDVDVLKVPHHGSSGSSSVKLFEIVHPKIAMIGVGKHNLYGHPSDIVIERLKQRHIMILRTDEDGSSTIRQYGSRYYVFR